MAIDEGGATHRAFGDLPAACHGDDGPFIGLKSAEQRTMKTFTELLSKSYFLRDDAEATRLISSLVRDSIALHQSGNMPVRLLASYLKLG